jgi:hypothetical protein
MSPNVLRRDHVKRQLTLQFLRLVLSFLLFLVLVLVLCPTVHLLLSATALLLRLQLCPD